MDNNTNIQELKDLVQQFSEARDWDQYHDPKELSIGIITEASEILEQFRFKTPEQMEELFTNEVKRAHVEEEVADVFFFLLRFCQRNNIDLSEALRRKVAYNETRLPVEKVKGSNKKYTELN